MTVYYSCLRGGADRIVSAPLAVRPEDEPALDKLKLQAMQYDEEEVDFRIALAGARARVAAAGYPGGTTKTVFGGLIRTKRTVWPIGPHNDWMFDAKGRMYHSKQDGWVTRVIRTTPEDLRWHAMHGEVSLKAMTVHLTQMCQSATVKV